MGIVVDRLTAAGRQPETKTEKRVCYLPGNCGRIDCIEQWIFEHAEQLNGVYVFQTLSLGPKEGWEKAVMGGIKPVTPFIGTGLRDLVNRGLAYNIRSHLSAVPGLTKGMWRADVAFAHVSPPDPKGRVTLGLNAGLDYTAVKSAEFKVAVVNRAMPRFHIGTYYDDRTDREVEVGCAMYLTEFDLVIEIDEALLTHAMAPKQEQLATAARVAENVLDHLAESANTPGQLPHTLQLGIGTIPNAVADTLASRKWSIQGVWSEMFSDGVVDLYKRNLIRSVGGPHLRDRIVAGFVLGSTELYETLEENPDFAILPQEYVNDVAMIGLNPCMISINTTLAVSISGEVAAATIGTRLHSDVGGQFDFALGASRSKGGAAYIALLSTTRLRSGELESKIVPTHPQGAHHTITADLPIIVVTEHGVANLEALDDRNRVKAMIGVADPQWRKFLGREARKLPSLQGIDVLPPRCVKLHNGKHATLRPATDADIPAIREYIAQLSDEDRSTRYMSTITLAALTNSERLTGLYDKTLDYLEHAAFVLEMDNQIIGVAHAFRTHGDEDQKIYEISFSRRSDLEGLGIGGHLMNFLVDWAVAAGVTRLHAVTYRSNKHMRHLFELYRFKLKPGADDPRYVSYEGEVSTIAGRNE